MAEEKIRLGDGQEYFVSTLNLGDLKLIKKRFGTTNIKTDDLEQVSYWIFLSVKKKHPDISEEILDTLLDIPFINSEGYINLLSAISKVNGVEKNAKNQEAPSEKK